MEWAAAAVAGYLVGSIPFALIVGRAHGVDLRAAGDGNPGAWNALEQLGARRAWPVFGLDAAKGLAGGLIGLALGDVWTAYVGVAGAMIGHALPLFAGFRGGKAVMSFAGGTFAVAPLAASIALAACVLVSLVRGFRLGARAGVFGFPLVQLALDGAERTLATGALMSIIGLLYTPRLVRALAARRAGARAA